VTKVKTFSVAGSARFAREARTATPEHLRDTEIARRRYAAKARQLRMVLAEDAGDELTARF